MSEVKFKTGNKDWLPEEAQDGVFYALNDQKSLILDSKNNRYEFQDKSIIDSAINKKQDALVNNKNIKSLAYTSLLGENNIPATLIGTEIDNNSPSGQITDLSNRTWLFDYNFNYSYDTETTTYSIDTMMSVFNLYSILESSNPKSGTYQADGTYMPMNFDRMTIYNVFTTDWNRRIRFFSSEAEETGYGLSLYFNVHDGDYSTYLVYTDPELNIKIESSNIDITRPCRTVTIKGGTDATNANLISFITQSDYIKLAPNKNVILTDGESMIYPEAEMMKYTTDVPTADNVEGIKIVLLQSEPETKYNGWLYLIAEGE